MTEAICSSLEVEIETEWLSLCRAPKPRNYFLTSGNKLVHGQRAKEASHYSIEIGWFTRTITLADFRSEVFFVFDQRQGKRYG